MNDLTRGTKVLMGVAVGLFLALVIAIVVFLTVRAVEAEKREEAAYGAIAELMLQNRGPQGPDGKQGPPGRAPTQEEIAAAVEAYCAEHDECRGPQGAPGKNGSNGATGPAGVNGVNGSPITKVTCHGTFIRFWVGSTAVGDIAMICLR